MHDFRRTWTHIADSHTVNALNTLNTGAIIVLHCWIMHIAVRWIVLSLLRLKTRTHWSCIIHWSLVFVDDLHLWQCWFVTSLDTVETLNTFVPLYPCFYQHSDSNCYQQQPATTTTMEYNALNIFVEEPTNLPHFETFNEDEVLEKQEASITPVLQKRRTRSLSVSNILVLHSRNIHAFVGPSRLYLLLKGMKLENMKVTTIKFIGNVPRVDIEMYVSRRPNVTKVIMDSYGPVSCTWTEFDEVRKNLTSFVVRCGDGYLDVCNFIDFSNVLLHCLSSCCCDLNINHSINRSHLFHVLYVYTRV